MKLTFLRGACQSFEGEVNKPLHWQGSEKSTIEGGSLAKVLQTAPPYLILTLLLHPITEGLRKALFLLDKDSWDCLEIR